MMTRISAWNHTIGDISADPTVCPECVFSCSSVFGFLIAKGTQATMSARSARGMVIPMVMPRKEYCGNHLLTTPAKMGPMIAPRP